MEDLILKQGGMDGGGEGWRGKGQGGWRCKGPRTGLRCNEIRIC